MAWLFLLVRSVWWGTSQMSSDQGPVVQSVVSLTSSIRVILVDSIYIILIFFAEKNVSSKSYSHFFSKKFQHICVSLDVNFNESLTKDIVSFEQLGPDTFFWWTRENYPRNIIRCFQLVTYLSEILTPIINIWKTKQKKKYLCKQCRSRSKCIFILSELFAVT